MTERHTTIRDGKRLVWYTEKLWARAAKLPSFDLSISEIAELDEDCWFENRPPTLREVAKHCRRIIDADSRYPIILNADGSLMDGGHRLCQALLEGRATVRAVRFETMPPPDDVLEVETS